MTNSYPAAVVAAHKKEVKKIIDGLNALTIPKQEIAKLLGMSYRSYYSKINGLTEFTFLETKMINYLIR